MDYGFSTNYTSLDEVLSLVHIARSLSLSDTRDSTFKKTVSIYLLGHCKLQKAFHKVMKTELLSV